MSSSLTCLTHNFPLSAKALGWAVIVILITLSSPVCAQEQNITSTVPGIIIPTFEKAQIKIDGNLSEVEWVNVPGYDNMTVVEPDTLQTASLKTTTQLFYTDEGLYVGARMEQPPEHLIARLSSRDANVNRDSFTLYLDTTGEGQYGFFFGVNLGGSLTDGTFLPERQFSNLWDGPWQGAAMQTKSGYAVEMFLPWSMMAMPEGRGIRNMSFAIARRVAYLDELWQWPALPDSKPEFISGFQPIELRDVEPGRQLVFYPFTAVTRDRSNSETNYRVGADLYWRPSTNLQLTATLNPDFGAVESDDVVVNLTAFETFFPEKRPFFLEGSEIFITSPRAEIRGTATTTGARQVQNSFFLQPTTLVNTRRIGGPAKTPDVPPGAEIPDVQLGQPTELIGAAKITGQHSAFRYGVMTAAEEDSGFNGFYADGSTVKIDQEGRDFGVFRMLYEPTTAGRKAIGMISTITAHPDEDAVTHGVDLHYRSDDSKLIWDAQLLYSDVDQQTGSGGYFDMNYIPKRGSLHRFSFDYLDEDLDINALGFIRRNDVITYRYTYNLSNSNHPKFRFRNDGLTLSHETNLDGRTVRSSLYYRNTLTFKSRNQLNSTILFRPAQWDDRTSEGNGEYRTEPGGILEFAYGTDTSKVISMSFAGSALVEQLGGTTYTAKAGITYKPTDRFSADFDLTYRRPDDWLIHLDGSTLGTYDAKHWQASLTLDTFLTAKQQLRFSMQWIGIQANAQNLYRVPERAGSLDQITNGIDDDVFDFTISRLTTQLRYRWEIAPLSDLFVVYTRGSNLPNRQDDSFSRLFRDSLNKPIIDMFVIKLRYRINP